MEPKVSIIIPTFGRSDRIDRAIDSALKQNYSNFEVIVVDDNGVGSIERIKTEEKVNKYSKVKNFKYYQHEKNLNGAAARNTGIKLSTGEYITFLDDDDEYFPDKIKYQVEALKNLNSSWAMCYTGYKKIDQFGNIQYSSERSEGYLPIQSLSKNLFMGSGSNFMVRKKVVEEVSGFDETFIRNQDLEFMSRILLKYKIKYVNYVGFLIHNEIREKKYTYEDMMTINDNYRVKFNEIINTLSVKDRRKVFVNLALIDIRIALTFRKFKEAILIYYNNQISPTVIFKYFRYLLRRIITKESYGFKY